MVRALTYFAGFRGDNPRAWLLQIVRNVALGKLGARVEPVSLDAAETSSGESLADTLTDGADGPRDDARARAGSSASERIVNRPPVECAVSRPRDRRLLVQGDRTHHRRSDRYGDVAAMACATNVERPCRRAGEAIMSAEFRCGQELLLQADFDGELDASQPAALHAHLESCTICEPARARLGARGCCLRVRRGSRRANGCAQMSSSWGRRNREAMSRRRRARALLRGGSATWFRAPDRCIGRGTSDLRPRRRAASRVAESVIDNHLRAVH